MPTELSIREHLDALRVAVGRLARYAGQAGPAATVPTRPGWTVHDLVVHQGAAHRWVTAVLRGGEPGDRAPEAFESEGRAAGDALAWLLAGADELAATVAGSAPDAPAIVFLDDAPAPRAFWARRSCLETTVHAVDALAAVLGRAPRPEETWIGRRLAVDGIDEVLGGFLTRPGSPLRCPDEQRLAVAPDDAPDWWLVRIGPHPAVTSRRTRASAVPDEALELTGPAVELFLRLCDRTPAPAREARESDRSADCQGRKSLVSS
jgi:uncharacterized protein (TIGR03083 family)